MPSGIPRPVPDTSTATTPTPVPDLKSVGKPAYASTGGKGFVNGRSEPAWLPLRRPSAAASAPCASPGREEGRRREEEGG
eukprot:698277-Rhodomonas_salina.1